MLLRTSSFVLLSLSVFFLDVLLVDAKFDAAELMNGKVFHVELSGMPKLIPGEGDDDASSDSATDNGSTERQGLPSTPETHPNFVYPDQEVSVTETVELASKFGQRYSCHFERPLPIKATNTSDPGADGADSLSNVTVDMVKLLKGSVFEFNPSRVECLYKHTGWWSYKVCNRGPITQYHLLENGDVEEKSKTILGHFLNETDWSADGGLSPNDTLVKEQYHSINFGSGTTCDLTNAPRVAEIRLFCSPDIRENVPGSSADRIMSLEEPESCSYVVHIHVAKLCRHPVFAPARKASAPTLIQCAPQLEKADYLRYLKIKAENAEKRRAEQAAMADTLRREGSRFGSILGKQADMTLKPPTSGDMLVDFYENFDLIRMLPPDARMSYLRTIAKVRQYEQNLIRQTERLLDLQSGKKPLLDDTNLRLDGASAKPTPAAFARNEVALDTSKYDRLDLEYAQTHAYNFRDPSRHDQGEVDMATAVIDSFLRRFDDEDDRETRDMLLNDGRLDFLVDSTLYGPVWLKNAITKRFNPNMPLVALTIRTKPRNTRFAKVTGDADERTLTLSRNSDLHARGVAFLYQLYNDGVFYEALDAAERRMNLVDAEESGTVTDTVSEVPSADGRSVNMKIVRVSTVENEAAGAPSEDLTLDQLTRFINRQIRSAVRHAPDPETADENGAAVFVDDEDDDDNAWFSRIAKETDGSLQVKIVSAVQTPDGRVVISTEADPTATKADSGEAEDGHRKVIDQEQLSDLITSMLHGPAATATMAQHLRMQEAYSFKSTGEAARDESTTSTTNDDDDEIDNNEDDKTLPPQ